MSEPNLNITPRGWLEKADDANVGVMLIVVLVVLMFDPLQERAGFWPSLVLLALSGIALIAITTMSVVPLKRRRAQLDAEKGIFECSLRESGSSSYKGRWTMGYAQALPGQIVFQARNVVLRSLIGLPEVYSNVRRVTDPVKAPWSVFARGEVATFDTDRGAAELAATRSSVNLLTERCLGVGS